MNSNSPLWLGVDIGSTTVKIVALDPADSRVLYSTYRRHGAKQAETAALALEDLASALPGATFKAAVCGSGGKGAADAIGAQFVQEVVANSLAVRSLYPQARTAIELGGQDAKIIFFHYDEARGRMVASDMRMNGACAGGTGAFIEEVATLLHVPVEKFDALAAKGRKVYDISGRCGVFAKTDIQPLLNQGVRREDIALSTFHAVVKQTVGGLAQGLEIHSPVVFEGGPLTFNRTLVDVFIERLGLSEEGTIIPDSPETLVALGTALSIGAMRSEATLDLAAAPGKLREFARNSGKADDGEVRYFFKDAAEREAFEARHAPPEPFDGRLEPRQRVWIGIDGGSTTSKCAALDDSGRVLATWYAHNRGQPLDVTAKLLGEMRAWFAGRGVEPEVAGVGVTGYAEALFASAFKADYHTVETVAHAAAARHFVPGATFVLDIGGQDMKAIMIDADIVTGIVLNEACSAGCGSFLENFASSLSIKADEIAGRAFASTNPSRLGSRCTVFMNSSIITEQRNGKGPDDIMAGLCRSIVDNVFTKVVRLPNLDALGERIVVQGGTFRNAAVLRAMEQFVDRPVTRAPYPGEMGAIGIALLTKRDAEERGATSSRFPGFAALESFSYERRDGVVCPYCTNNCNRTVIRFSDGSSFVTGNRCERGEQIDASAEVSAEAARKAIRAPDLMKLSERLIFAPREPKRASPEKRIKIGIPRALEFWNSYPFWQAYFRSLGFEVALSSRSTQALFQSGLQNVPSDTVCFPAKLVHGHIRDLVAQKVDRIFMPMLNRLPVENESTTGSHMCAVVKGYPLVIRHSDDPERKAGIPYDCPMFHWFDRESRDAQLAQWTRATFALPDEAIRLAISEGDEAMAEYRREMETEGRLILDSLPLARKPGFAVILAGRPYHGDFLVNHDLSGIFSRLGVPVLTLDSLPGLENTDLSKVRAELTNPFHTRVYAAAMLAARNPDLELVQIVSFGCGHDAIISDEIQTIMREVSGKAPLVLKLDESEVKGPLAIRVRSFIETVAARRAERAFETKELPDPFPAKFLRRHRKELTILVPNVSEWFPKIAGAAMESEGYRVEPLPLGGREAMALGKRFVHNDICYPAQVNIGEALAALGSGRYDPNKVALGLAKAECDCRLAHYAALARKALDEAGYSMVPIITTDRDNKGMHPGFKLGLRFQLRAMWGINMVDALERARRRMRPYERRRGSVDALFEESAELIAAGLRKSTRRAMREFDRAIKRFASLDVDLSYRKPRVFVIGEFLLNFHPGSNNYIEDYLVDHGLEAVFPDVFTPVHRDYYKKESEVREFGIRYPGLDIFANDVTMAMIARVQRIVNAKMRALPWVEPQMPIRELAGLSDDVVHHSFTPGEGWLMAAEILHQAAIGVESFVILQPFGCLPNHIVGRGLIKALKERAPNAQILPLDFDPDTSFANVENRLQMLVINAKESART
jgi:predicted CoA-substrate-specific enzyme activase